MTPPRFDPKIVRALAEILTDTGLTELEVETKEGRVRIARTPAAIAQPLAAPTMTQAPPPRSRRRPQTTPSTPAPC